MERFLSMLYFGLMLSLLSCQCENPSGVTEKKYDNKVVWSYPILEGFGDLTKPVINDGKAFIPSNSILICARLADGKKLWQIDLGGHLASEDVLYDNGSIYLVLSDKILCFNAASGEKIWETLPSDFIAQSLSTISQTQTYLFIGGNNGKTVKISKSTGSVDLIFLLTQLIWNGYTQSARHPVASTSDNYLYIPTGWWTGEELRGNLLCFNSETGEYLWGYETTEKDASILGCAISDSIIVFPSGQSMIALNRFSGKKIWNVKIVDDAFWWNPTIINGTVYMGSSAKGKMYAFDLRTGEIKWISEETPSSIITLITVQDGKVFFCNNSRIYVLNAYTGKTIWWGHPPEHDKDGVSTYSSPVAVGEGYMVNVGSSKVYCLKVTN